MSSSITGLAPAERHRAVAAGFTEQVAVVSDWDAPTPVGQWAARDVVAHLVEWFPAFLAGGGVILPDGPSVDDGPDVAWRAHSDSVQALLDSPAADDTFRHPMAGEHRLADAIDQFYTADVYMHTWDLAVSAGRRPDLDPAFATQLLDGMAGIEELLRSSGQYGPAMPVPDDADPVTRLVGFIGRDPGWRAAAPRA
ncbi:maleylpyruvate isomerase family mycothiol-dependent enzyme [Gordonia sp. NPDC003424]